MTATIAFAAKSIGEALAIPDDDAFWIELGNGAKASLRPIVEDVIRRGVQATVNVGVAVDFAMVDRIVLDVTREYLDDWWTSLSRTRRNALRRALVKMQTGELAGTGVRAVERELAKFFDAARARVIAETETTRLFAIGAEAGYVSAGIPEYEWQTAEDDLVDDVCAALNGRIFKVGGTGPLPPAHPRCRCTTAPVPADLPALEAV